MLAPNHSIQKTRTKSNSSDHKTMSENIYIYRERERETLGREEADDGGALHGECTDMPSCSSSLPLPPLSMKKLPIAIDVLRRREMLRRSF